MFKDPIIDAEDLPDDVKQIYLEWLHQDIPIWLQNKINALVESDMIQYDKVNRELLTKYALVDIILTIETYLNTQPAVESRGTYQGIDIEKQINIPTC